MTDLRYVPDAERLRADVEALAAMTRDSAGAGERKAAAWAQGRLVECGVNDVRVEHYRARGTNSWSFAAHSVIGLAAMRIGGVRGAALAALAAASLERDASGRWPWRRRWLGGGRGANAVGVIEPSAEPRSTAVLVAHLDAAKTGLVWHPALARVGAARRERTRRADPVMGLQALGLLLAAAASALTPRDRPVRGCNAVRKPRVSAAARGGAATRLRRAVHVPATALNTLAIAANLDIARSPTVPGANDDATGVAAALDLARALANDPLEHTRVVIALVGSEESGMGGFHALLTSRPELLDPQRTFVLGLDGLGCGTPILAAAEGAILTHRYRDEDLALVDEGAALAGEPAPQRWRIGAWTDPLLALTRGIPSTCLLSIGPGGSYTHYHVLSDLPEHVGWDSVQACARIAAGTLRALDRR